MKKLRNYSKLLCVGLGLLSYVAYASEGGDGTWLTLQQQWEINNYQLQGDAQLKAFERLVAEADQMLAQHPADARVYVWSGIVKSTYAGIKGGLGALKYARASKIDLEKAIELEPQVLEGSAYTSLGVLYYKVPGFPLGFGDDKKAEELLKKALSINPRGIDANYFYAEFLVDQKKYYEAREFLHRAANAPDRPGRMIADQGRHRDIQQTLAEIDRHT